MNVVASRRRLLTLGITLASLMAGCFLLKGCTDFPSDQELKARFAANRSCFERIRAMALEDSQNGVDRITSDRVQFVTNLLPKDSERSRVLPDARLKEYRHLFICAGIDQANGGILFGSESVTFLAATRGLAGSGNDKGYFWATEAPEPLVTSLDDLQAPATSQWFESIDTNWYLEFTQD